MDLPQRIHKPKYTTQDVRAQAIQARDELIANLEFIMECIREDRLKLQRYKEKFGDLRYRPILKEAQDSIEAQYGAPAQIYIEPLASQYRTTINSLLQSIRLIQDEILPPEDAEGATSIPAGEAQETTSRRKSLRAEFRADASTPKAPIQPTEPESDLNPTELVQNDHSHPTDPNSPTTQQNPRPWRETTPRTMLPPQVKFVPRTEAPTHGTMPPNTASPETPNNHPPVVKEPNQSTQPKNLNPGQVGLSPALRMQMQGGANRLDSIRDKYRSGVSSEGSGTKGNESNSESED